MLLLLQVPSSAHVAQVVVTNSGLATPASGLIVAYDRTKLGGVVSHGTKVRTDWMADIVFPAGTVLHCADQ